MKIKKWPWRMFHVPKGIAYAVGNSRLGTWIAYKLGFKWLDKDIQVTSDGVPIYAHWPKVKRNGFKVLPGWFTDKYGPDPIISHCEWADLQRLSTPKIAFRGRRNYKFQSVRMGLKYAHSLGMKIGNEQKGSPALRHKQFWIDLHQATSEIPLSKKLVMTLPHMPGAIEVMKAAHEADWPTMVIQAETGVPSAMKPYLTYYRGNIRWIEGPR